MKKLIFLLLLLKFDFNSGAQGTFQKTYGGGTAYDIKKTSDGNLIVTGDPCFLLKIDQNGSVLWYKAYSSPAGGLTGASVEQTNDGGFIIGGTLNFGTPTSEVLLLKTDANGNPQWAKTYGGYMDDYGSEAKQTLDGGYVIVGSARSFGTNFDDIYVIKTDGNGNLQWSKDIADSPIDVVDHGNSIVQSVDSGYVIAGYIDNPLGNNNDVGLIKVDKTGSLVWAKSYGGTGDDMAYSLITTSDGGYAVVGYTQSFGAGWTDAYIIKTDSAGNLSWSKTFGSVYGDEAHSVEEITSGNYFLSGFGTSANFLGRGATGIKLNANGDTVWAKVYGDQGEVGWAAKVINNSYLIIGNSQSLLPDDVYVVKSDSLGNNSCYTHNLQPTVTTPATIVTTPSVTVSTPATVVNSISITANNINTVNTLCSLVTVPEITNDQAITNGRLIGIYDVLGRQVSQTYPDNIYIYKYEDKKGNSFFKKVLKVEPF